ncbi:MAG: glycosyltransferase family 2 protein [Bacteroidales bacterium]|nr:glycosyltransferase family 2 protein [Bacteroidales bacterium]
MLHHWLTTHHIVLQKGQNLHIVLQLLWNYILRIKLQLYKKIRGIKHPIVHYYCVCWNEERMLPFVFDYYSRFVSHFTIYDNYSTDRSEALVNARPDAEMRKFGIKGIFDDSENQRVKNHCWKQSRGKADWVVVCDTDEFVYHPDLQNHLETLRKQRVSFPDIIGFEMYSLTYPTPEQGLITDQVRRGYATDYMKKHLIFDPHRIVETHFTPGCHAASPVGIVKNSKEPLKLLHYKYLGKAEVIARNRTLGKKLSDANKEQEMGFHYLLTEERMEQEFDRHYAETIEVI